MALVVAERLAKPVPLMVPLGEGVKVPGTLVREGEPEDDATPVGVAVCDAVGEEKPVAEAPRDALHFAEGVGLALSLCEDPGVLDKLLVTEEEGEGLDIVVGDALGGGVRLGYGEAEVEPLAMELGEAPVLPLAAPAIDAAASSDGACGAEGRGVGEGVALPEPPVAHAAAEGVAEALLEWDGRFVGDAAAVADDGGVGVPDAVGCVLAVEAAVLVPKGLKLPQEDADPVDPAEEVRVATALVEGEPLTDAVPL